MIGIIRVIREEKKKKGLMRLMYLIQGLLEVGNDQQILYMRLTMKFKLAWVRSYQWALNLISSNLLSKKWGTIE